MTKSARGTASRRDTASRIASVLLACVAGIMGFVAFNVVDGIFGVTKAIVGIAACIATTIFVFRRSPPEERSSDV